MCSLLLQLIPNSPKKDNKTKPHYGNSTGWKSRLTLGAEAVRALRMEQGVDMTGGLGPHVTAEERLQACVVEAGQTV